MRIKLTGRYLEDIIPILKSENFIFDDIAPEIVIAHGGDGTLLGAVRDYPNVPKLPIRDKRSAPLCDKHNCEKIIALLKSGDLKSDKLIKIAGYHQDKKVLGVNDIFIHNKDRVGAIRYRVHIDEELYADGVVGDGVGVSTIHGSTAYYRSITHSIFRTGIGLAFSNSTEVTNHLVLPEESTIKITISRGPAILVADNSPDSIDLKNGDQVEIKQTTDFAEILGLDIFMCYKCRKLRHSQKM